MFNRFVGLHLRKFTSQRFTTTTTTTFNWSEFFALRQSRKRWEIGTGIITGFIGFQTATFYFLFVAKYDPTNLIMGMDPAMVYMMAITGIGIGGFLVGNLVATPIWRAIKNKNTLQLFDSKEKEFLRRVRKHRPLDLLSVGPGDNVRVLDYFGERIKSVKEYRAWLKVQRNFKKTGRLPLRLGG